MRRVHTWKAVAVATVLFAALPSSGSESVLGLKLGTVGLHDVISKLGPAKLARTGDASTSETSLCYHTKAGEFLVFASNNEMAGPNLELTAIRLSQSPPLESECAEYSAEKALRLSNGLGLGSTEAEVKAAAEGEPSPEGGYVACSKHLFMKGTPAYDRWANAKGCFAEGEEPYFSVCTGLSARFEDGRAVWIQISRIESVC